MSLINDALKKVSEAERGKPAAPQTDFEMRAMQPVAYEKRSPHLLWLSAALFIGAIGIAVFVFAKSRTVTAVSPTAKTANAVGETQVTVNKVAKPPIEEKAPTAEGSKVATAVIEPSTPAAVPAVNPSNTIAIATPASPVQAAPTPAQPVAAPVPAGPTFRLKGILYTKNPTALINEASVQVGGEVDGATVTKIESTSVTLDYQGKTTILKLAAKK
jgi:hypothetical protein